MAPSLAATLNPKVCSCGARYDREAWRALKLVGVQRDDERLLELRNCRCGSTLVEAVACADAPAPTVMVDETVRRPERASMQPVEASRHEANGEPAHGAGPRWNRGIG